MTQLEKSLQINLSLTAFVAVFSIALALPSFSSANAVSCSALFGEKQGTQPKANVEILDILKKHDDPSVAMDRALAQAALGDKLKAPTAMSNKMNEYRSRVLPELLASAERRESMVRLAEAQLRVRSEILADRLARSKSPEYDLVIQGAGVHSAILAARLKYENPGLRILIAEAQDTVGSNFRLLGDMIRLNSTLRATGDGSRPLPREGNVNFLPFLPIQASDLATARFPYAKDLGDPLVLAYHALNSLEGVDILLSTRAESQRAPNPETARVKLSRGANQIAVVEAYRSVGILGLGKTTLPPAIARFLEENPSYGTSSNGNLPIISTYETAMHQMAASNNPAALVANKVVGVAGGKDGGATFLEAIAALTDSKSFSNAEVGLPSLIYWFGQSAKTCEEWIENARSRYNGVGSLLPSTKTGRPGIAQGIEPKVSRVEKSATGRGIRVILENGSSYEADHLVLATGSKTPDYNPSQFQLVKDRVQNFGFVNIARFDTRTNTYVAGPGAGNLNPDLNLYSVNENFVAIFRNAPLVVKLAERLAAEFKGLSGGPMFQPPKLRQDNLVAQSTRGSIIEIDGIKPTRTFGAQNVMQYLATVFDYAVSQVRIDGSQDLDFQIRFNPRTPSAYVTSKNYEIKNLVEVLAATKDFFNLTTMLLQSLQATQSDVGLQIRIQNGKAKVSVVGPGSLILNGASPQFIQNGAKANLGAAVEPVAADSIDQTSSQLAKIIQEANKILKVENNFIEAFSTPPTRIGGIRKDIPQPQTNEVTLTGPAANQNNTRIPGIRREIRIGKIPPNNQSELRGIRREIPTAFPKEGFVEPDLQYTLVTTGSEQGVVEYRTGIRVANRKSPPYELEGKVSSINVVDNNGEIYRIETNLKQEKKAEYFLRFPKNPSERPFIWGTKNNSARELSPRVQSIVAALRSGLITLAETSIAYREKEAQELDQRMNLYLSSVLLDLEKKRQTITYEDFAALLNTLGIGSAFIGKPSLAARMTYLENALRLNLIAGQELGNFYAFELRNVFSVGRLIPDQISKDPSFEKARSFAIDLVAQKLIEEQIALDSSNANQSDTSTSLTSKIIPQRLSQTLASITPGVEALPFRFFKSGKEGNTPDFTITSSGRSQSNFTQELEIKDNNVISKLKFTQPVRRVSALVGGDHVEIQLQDGTIVIACLAAPGRELRTYTAREQFQSDTLNAIYQEMARALRQVFAKAGNDPNALTVGLRELDKVAADYVKEVLQDKKSAKITPEELLFALQISNPSRIEPSFNTAKDYFASSRAIFESTIARFEKIELIRNFQSLPIQYYRKLLLQMGYITNLAINASNIEALASVQFGINIRANRSAEGTISETQTGAGTGNSAKATNGVTPGRSLKELPDRPLPTTTASDIYVAATRPGVAEVAAALAAKPAKEFPQSGKIEPDLTYKITTFGGMRTESEVKTDIANSVFPDNPYTLVGTIVSIEPFAQGRLYRVVTVLKDGTNKEYLLRFLKTEKEEPFLWSSRPDFNEGSTSNRFKNFFEQFETLVLRNTSQAVARAKFEADSLSSALATLSSVKGNKQELQKNDLVDILNTLDVSSAFVKKPTIENRKKFLEKALELKIISVENLTHFLNENFRSSLSASRGVGNNDVTLEAMDAAQVRVLKLITDYLITTSTDLESNRDRRTSIPTAIFPRNVADTIISIPPGIADFPISFKSSAFAFNSRVQGTRVFQQIDLGGAVYAFQKPIRRVSSLDRREEIFEIEFENGSIKIVSSYRSGRRDAYTAKGRYSTEGLNGKYLEVTRKLQELFRKYPDNPEEITLGLNALDKFTARIVTDLLYAARNKSSLAPEQLLLALQISTPSRIDPRNRQVDEVNTIRANGIFTSAKALMSKSEWESKYQRLPLSYYRSVLIELGKIQQAEIVPSVIEKVATETFGFEVKARN